MDLTHQTRAIGGKTITSFKRHFMGIDESN